MTESATHPSAITADPAAHRAFGLTDILLFAMAAIWGTNFVVVKYATHIFNPVAFTGLRVGVAAMSLLGVAFIGGGITIPRRDVIGLLLLGVLGNGLYQLFFVLGALLVFLGVICWTVYTIGLQPYAKRINIIQLSAITLVGGAIPLLIASAPALISTDWSAVGIGGWLAVFYSSVISMGVAYFFWYRGLRVLGPTRTAVYSNLQPIVALLVAWAFLNETPTIFQGVGAATIIAGVFLTRT